MRPVTTTKPIASTTTSPFGPVAVIVDGVTHGGAVKVELDDIRAALEATGLDHTIEVADGPDDVRNLARSAFDRGVRFVAVAGDDGSVQDVVNAAFRGGRTVVEQPVIGVIPAGTGCELVRSFGLPDDVVGAVSHLRGDGSYALDVMKLTVTDVGGERRTVYGHNMAQIGFRAAVASRSSAPRRRIGSFAAFWGTYVSWRRRDVTLQVDTRTHELRAWDVIVANGQFADGAQRISPRSYPGDGVLDALAFVGPRSDAYRMLPRIFMNGGHLPDAGVKELRAKIRVAVSCDRPLPIVLDGRPVGTTPATVQIVPQQVLLKL
jgi:diacylglycerol kinase family enzyme